ncbi:hypothetical protein H2200_010106 [Cladophialophora chaetospira]|uniref:catalase n=1 Tax=Cladophialophora chaetospira TaxID=386627 RepID=A0AA39CEP6_9EURO|nr:hypothetical protein H2200_010106 [Cladophialophora chaetospira]
MRYQHLIPVLSLAVAVAGQDVTNSKLQQLQAAMANTNGQIETADNGVPDNTSNSLQSGPRGYNLLEDTTVRKKIIHFDHERAPERVVHALGHGAYGQFESYGDWSNMTSACWLQSGAVSETFTRFSVVLSSNGGSEVNRDTHGFATKIYSKCGNQDLVGNHVPSFFINDGADFPDLVHAGKFEADKGFPTGGSAHTTAYDFFTQHPEGAYQLMNVLTDIGIPRDIRHISGNGVHTYRFINAQGRSQLFKWYWLPQLGHRSLVYDEALKLVGKNGNFHRVDLYSNIKAGNFPQWDFAVQLFPDDGTYMYNGIDLLIPTQIVPFEMNPPVRLGKLTLNRNPNNFFAEPESISFAPSNVVAGVSFVPDPLLQWRLMAYDDTATHRHNSANGYLLPINKAIAPINNNYRDGYMQPLIFTGESTSTPDGIGGVVESGTNATIAYTGTTSTSVGTGTIGRYAAVYDWFGQARYLWGTLDVYAQQHLVDAYRFELGNVANTSVTQVYIDNILNPIDNCLARRVAYGLGATIPAMGSGPRTNITNSTTPFPSIFPINPGVEPNKSLVGLSVAVIANDTLFSTADFDAMAPLLSAQNITLTVVGPHFGMLNTGVNATSSYVTASSVFFDAVFVGSVGSNTSASSNNSTTGALGLDMNAMGFVMEAYSHGKAIGALGSSGAAILRGMGLDFTPSLGLYSGDASQVTQNVLAALRGPVRFPQRFPTDDVSTICGK